MRLKYGINELFDYFKLGEMNFEVIEMLSFIEATQRHNL
ncbi:MAG: hypothetical protein KIIPBIDF_01002 [Candidatus Methanoperedenaceae archaeon GB50]|nr:MAG: hypothetical protein KIIPBIDF_01002 [Candidatus Methanoperedenaceae archaeon GB50]